MRKRQPKVIGAAVRDDIATTTLARRATTVEGSAHRPRDFAASARGLSRAGGPT